MKVTFRTDQYDQSLFGRDELLILKRTSYINVEGRQQWTDDIMEITFWTDQYDQ